MLVCLQLIDGLHGLQGALFAHMQVKARQCAGDPTRSALVPWLPPE